MPSFPRGSGKFCRQRRREHHRPTDVARPPCGWWPPLRTTRRRCNTTLVVRWPEQGIPPRIGASSKAADQWRPTPAGVPATHPGQDHASRLVSDDPTATWPAWLAGGRGRSARCSGDGPPPRSSAVTCARLTTPPRWRCNMVQDESRQGGCSGPNGTPVRLAACRLTYAHRLTRAARHECHGASRTSLSIGRAE